MKFEIIAVDKVRNAHLRALTDDYLGRIARYVPVEEIEVRKSSMKASGAQSRRSEEAAALLGAASAGSVGIALDERGAQVTSRQLAGWVDEWMVSGLRYISFYVGGADGLDHRVRDHAQKTLALSKMTMPHEMARMVLAEQLYRAMTLIRGEPYHR